MSAIINIHEGNTPFYYPTGGLSGQELLDMESNIMELANHGQMQSMADIKEIFIGKGGITFIHTTTSEFQVVHGARAGAGKQNKGTRYIRMAPSTGAQTKCTWEMPVEKIFDYEQCTAVFVGGIGGAWKSKNGRFVGVVGKAHELAGAGEWPLPRLGKLDVQMYKNVENHLEHPVGKEEPMTIEEWQEMFIHHASGVQHTTRLHA